jgi:hypothetical protein
MDLLAFLVLLMACFAADASVREKGKDKQS